MLLQTLFTSLFYLDIPSLRVYSRANLKRKDCESINSQLKTDKTSKYYHCMMIRNVYNIKLFFCLSLSLIYIFKGYTDSSSIWIHQFSTFENIMPHSCVPMCLCYKWFWALKYKRATQTEWKINIWLCYNPHLKYILLIK